MIRLLFHDPIVHAQALEQIENGFYRFIILA